MGSVEYKVIRRSGRNRFVCRWFDEARGWREKTLQATRRRDAERLAAEFISTLGLAAPQHDPLTWLGFRTKYEAEKGPTMTSALVVWRSAANQLERIVAPVMLTDVTGPRLSSYAVGLRAAELSEATIGTYLRAIRAALNWAGEIELLATVPRVRIPKTAGQRRARGRAITGEEFERLLEAMGKHVGPNRYPSWAYLLRGLWSSGLRLGESLNLWWDNPQKIVPLNLDGRRPTLRVPNNEQKNRKDQTCPLAPEFVEFLRLTPAEQRTGPVFAPLGKSKVARGTDYVSRQISAAGRLAKVVVARDGDEPRYVTAHDLRRSFGDRWAQKVMPAVLKELMRHADISTTMAYYVGRSAEQTADILWQTVTRAGDSLGDIAPSANSVEYS